MSESPAQDTTETTTGPAKRIVVAEDETLIRLDIIEILRVKATTSSPKPTTASAPSSSPKSTSRIW